MPHNLQPAKAKRIIEEVADAVAETVAGLLRHTLDFVDFKQVGEVMLSEWNEGLSVIWRNKGVLINTGFLLLRISYSVFFADCINQV